MLFQWTWDQTLAGAESLPLTSKCGLIQPPEASPFPQTQAGASLPPRVHRLSRPRSWPTWASPEARWALFYFTGWSYYFLTKSLFQVELDEDLNYHQLAGLLSGYHQLSQLLDDYPQASVLLYASLANIFMFLLNLNFAICLICTCRKRRAPALSSSPRGETGQRALTYDINIV